jgi:hypothetical protein
MRTTLQIICFWPRIPTEHLPSFPHGRQISEIIQQAGSAKTSQGRCCPEEQNCFRSRQAGGEAQEVGRKDSASGTLSVLGALCAFQQQMFPVSHPRGVSMETFGSAWKHPWKHGGNSPVSVETRRKHHGNMHVSMGCFGRGRGNILKRPKSCASRLPALAPELPEGRVPKFK